MDHDQDKNKEEKLKKLILQIQIRQTKRTLIGFLIFFTLYFAIYGAVAIYRFFFPST